MDQSGHSLTLRVALEEGSAKTSSTIIRLYSEIRPWHLSNSNEPTGSALRRPTDHVHSKCTTNMTSSHDRLVNILERKASRTKVQRMNSRILYPANISATLTPSEVTEQKVYLAYAISELETYWTDLDQVP
jgi:hypothetical protein